MAIVVVLALATAIAVPVIARAWGRAGRFAGNVHERSEYLWDRLPEEGKANVRFLVLVDGRPLAGTLVAPAELQLQLYRFGGERKSVPGGVEVSLGTTTATGLQQNERGRYVQEGLEPGTYNLRIRHIRNDFREWTRQRILVAPDSSPLVEVDLER